MRVLGHVYAGEAFVVPAGGEDIVERANACRARLLDRHWKLHDIVIVPVEDEEVRPSHRDRSGTEQSPSAR